MSLNIFFKFARLKCNNAKDIFNIIPHRFSIQYNGVLPGFSFAPAEYQK